MDEARFWEMFESAWAVDPSLAVRRSGLLEASPNRVALAAEVEAGCQAMCDSVREFLSELDQASLLEFDRILERKLRQLDRRDIHAVTDGSDDGFLSCRGFIVAVGREYYEAVDRDPRWAVAGAECEAMTYVSMHVMDEVFDADAWTPSEISRESFTNRDGWKS